jgi:hypothetical protein
MKTVWVVGSVFVMLSCGTFLRDSPKQPGQQTESEVSPATAGLSCPRQETVTTLIADLEQCEAQIVTLTETVTQVKRVPVEKVITKVEKRRCADDGPLILPVPTTKCMSGQLCLDDEGQRVLVKNMAAYEAWVQNVKDCEAK